MTAHKAHHSEHNSLITKKKKTESNQHFPKKKRRGRRAAISQRRACTHGAGSEALVLSSQHLLLAAVCMCVNSLLSMCVHVVCLCAYVNACPSDASPHTLRFTRCHIIYACTLVFFFLSENASWSQTSASQHACASTSHQRRHQLLLPLFFSSPSASDRSPTLVIAQLAQQQFPSEARALFRRALHNLLHQRQRRARWTANAWPSRWLCGLHLRHWIHRVVACRCR